mgnify:CR=1 FL=1
MMIHMNEYSSIYIYILLYCLDTRECSVYLCVPYSTFSIVIYNNIYMGVRGDFNFNKS